MLDMSRNAVLKVGAVKKYLKIMACLGMNMLMLYLEDTYEMKEYPRFGYMRGRYTVEELREIDRFADSLGIEVIPCVQTLGHMEQYLKWDEARGVKDTGSVLLCGGEKTYALIEAMVKTMRAAFKSGRIHIGMDEAHDVGLGAYLRENGYKDRFETMNGHLKRVVEICKDNGFTPMMWGDMFFRLGSKTGAYYDADSRLSESRAASLPDVEIVYWDYYHTDGNAYETLMRAHEAIGKRTAFAGGIWIWGMLLPNIKLTFDTMLPAMKKCVECGITDVFATVWGDGGAETNHFFSLPGLPIFSEYCYLGGDCGLDDIKSVMAFVTKFTYDDVMAFSALNWDGGANYTGKALLYGERRSNMGKPVYYADLLYNMPGLKDYGAYQEKYLGALNHLNAAVPGESLSAYYGCAKGILKIAALKCEVLSMLKPAYDGGNTAYLKELSGAVLPGLKAEFDAMKRAHQALWLETNKAFGWEVVDMRYGAVIARLDYAIERIREYLSGGIDGIEELTVDAPGSPGQSIWPFQSVVSTSAAL
jgi:hypothetical protein